MSRLQSTKLDHQSVEVGVGDLGIVEKVVTPVVVFDHAAKFLGASPGAPYRIHEAEGTLATMSHGRLTTLRPNPPGFDLDAAGLTAT